MEMPENLCLEQLLDFLLDSEDLKSPALHMQAPALLDAVHFPTLKVLHGLPGSKEPSI